MPKKRLFIAVDISDEARRKAAEHIAELRGEFPNIRVGWERPEKLHITVQFLGDVVSSSINNIQNAVEAVTNTPCFEISISGTGVFPNTRALRILWLGVTAPRELIDLASAIGSALRPLGFDPEKRKFKPHLTIGRVREPQNAAALAHKHLSMAVDQEPFVVDHITIYESTLQPSGSVYSVLSRHELGG